MDENSTPAAPHTRFPYGPALLCLGCLVMCGYTWMRYSYAWSVTPGTLRSEKTPLVGEGRWPDCAYVRVRGIQTSDRIEDGGVIYLQGYWFPDSQSSPRSYSPPPAPGAPGEWVGRIAMEGVAKLDTAASRFYPASVAGLVVGAMGLFVFGLYLRSWFIGRKTLAHKPGQEIVA